MLPVAGHWQRILVLPNQIHQVIKSSSLMPFPGAYEMTDAELRFDS